MRIIAIDPGVGYCGVALLDTETPPIRLFYFDVIFDGVLDFGGVLAAAELFSNHTQPVGVIEVPRIYPGTPVRMDNIMQLSHWSGFFRGLLHRYCRVTVDVLPDFWKGQVPKDVHQSRLKKDHPEIELALSGIKKAHQQHAVDAAGLAYWYAERNR